MANSTWQRHHDSLSAEHDSAAWKALKRIVAQTHLGIAVLSQGDGLWRAWTETDSADGPTPQEAVLALAAKLEAEAGAEPVHVHSDALNEAQASVRLDKGDWGTHTVTSEQTGTGKGQ